MAEISGESVGFLRYRIWMASDGLVTNVSVGCVEIDDFETEG
jgi:hypothetical protein